MTEPMFTLDELLAYLGREEAPAEGYLTTREWAGELGVGYHTMKTLLVEAWARGVLRRRRDRRDCLDGITRRVPVYAFDLPGEGSHSDKVA